MSALFNRLHGIGSKQGHVDHTTRKTRIGLTLFRYRFDHALEQALYPRQPIRDDSLVCHADRGSQYVNIRYTERLAEAGIEPSVGSKGDSYDNALAEAINGLYKAELIHRRAPWKTNEAVEFATLEWASWFNHHRLLEPIGDIPPAEAEANYYWQLANQATTAMA